MGEVPHAIWASVPHRSTGARTGDLTAFVAEAETSVMTSVNEGDLPVSSATVDTNVITNVTDGRVVIAVRGAGTVHWVFPIIPDSVTLFWGRDGARHEARIGVEKRDP